jgi:hypothetical protein
LKTKLTSLSEWVQRIQRDQQQSSKNIEDYLSILVNSSQSHNWAFNELKKRYSKDTGQITLAVPNTFSADLLELLECDEQEKWRDISKRELVKSLEFEGM